MASPLPNPPPLSPVLLAGFLLRPVPLAVLQPAARAAMSAMRRRHPALFARLGPLAGSTFSIEPTDLPVRFSLRFSADAVALALLPHAERPATVTMRAPFMTLIDLLEGREDADAAFFARDVEVEGDTEAAMLLHNALEAADVRVIEDLIAGFGPLAPFARLVWSGVRTILDAFSRDLALLQAAALAPIDARCDRLAGDVRRLRTAAAGPTRRRPDKSVASADGRREDA